MSNHTDINDFASLMSLLRQYAQAGSISDYLDQEADIDTYGDEPFPTYRQYVQDEADCARESVRWGDPGAAMSLAICEAEVERVAGMTDEALAAEVAAARAARS